MASYDASNKSLFFDKNSSQIPARVWLRSSNLWLPGNNLHFIGSPVSISSSSTTGNSNKSCVVVKASYPFAANAVEAHLKQTCPWDITHAIFLFAGVDLPLPPFPCIYINSSLLCWIALFT